MISLCICLLSCLYEYVRVSVCVAYVRVSVISVCVYVCAYIFVCVCVYVCINICVCLCISVCVIIRVFAPVCDSKMSTSL